MEWVYLYQDIETQKMAYIGRSNTPEGCAGRIRSHAKEAWHGDKDWLLYFCPCKNRAESEAIETELINRFKPTANKAKKGWGLFLESELPIEVYPKVKESRIKSNYCMLADDLVRVENIIIERAKEEGVDLTS